MKFKPVLETDAMSCSIDSNRFRVHLIDASISVHVHCFLILMYADVCAFHVFEESLLTVLKINKVNLKISWKILRREEICFMTLIRLQTVDKLLG